MKKFFGTIAAALLFVGCGQSNQDGMGGAGENEIGGSSSDTGSIGVSSEVDTNTQIDTGVQVDTNVQVDTSATTDSGAQPNLDNPTTNQDNLNQSGAANPGQTPAVPVPPTE